MVDEDMKKFYSVLMAALIIGLVASCGKQNAEPVGDASIPNKAELNILEEIGVSNSKEALVEKYGKVAFHRTDTYNGVEERQYLYRDADRSVVESEYFLEIDENGNVYGFSPEENSAYRYIFMGDTYADYASIYGVTSGYVYIDGETILSQEEQENVITLRTKIEDQNILDGVSMDYLFERDAVDHLEMTYEVDAETKELFRLIGRAVMTDGTQCNLMEHERVLDPETYVVDEQLKELVFDGEQRTMTVIAYPGSDQEKVYTQTVSKGSGFRIVPPDGGTFYTDPECTIPNQGSNDKSADVILYYQ